MKKIKLQYGQEHIFFSAPDATDVVSSDVFSDLSEISKQVAEALENPIGGEPFSRIVRGKKTAVIVVSDNTRPVPYKGSDGVLQPLIRALKDHGISKIKIIIACGTHRPMKDDEIDYMLGECIRLDDIKVINHVATDIKMLRRIGETGRTPDITINKHYLDADVKILTGLVEPHFMAGYSGGRKAVCPGISGLEVTYGFHSAEILNDYGSRTLQLKNNPCHEEALKIAKMAGVDFIVNVTVGHQKKANGVFCGDLEKAHLAAIEHLNKFATVQVDKFYDVVITQAGEVGVNHYQCAKALVEASKVVKPNGKIILLAKLTDPDVIGGCNYKKTLGYLKQLGPESFMQKILLPSWEFIPEQWQVQMFSRSFITLGGAENLLICAPQLADYSGGLLCETNAAAMISRKTDETELNYACRLVSESLANICRLNHKADILVLPDGPYSVPVLKSS